MSTIIKIIVGVGVLGLLVWSFRTHTPATINTGPTATTTSTSTPVTATSTSTTTPSGTGSTSTSTKSGGGVLTGKVVGRVLLGPTCPVERIPPDPACAPRGYQTTIIARVSGKNLEVGRTQSDTQGKFTFSLLPGAYDFEALGGNPLPRCSVTTATLAKASTTNVNISCDTGIR